MIIDNNPVIDEINRTFTVQEVIDKAEDVVISVNGMWALYPKDIENIDFKTITISEEVELDFEDDMWVIYTAY